MHAVVRTYSGTGAGELFDILKERATDVERVISSVAGFHAYYAIRTADGGITITLCEDKTGADASVHVAREWVKENAPVTIANPPGVTEGTVVLQID
jgi:hypothetical protein